MSVSVIRYENGEKPTWGLLSGSSVLPLEESYQTLREFLMGFSIKKAHRFLENSKNGVELARVKILCPVTTPCNIVCQGKNYMDHLIETGGTPKSAGANIFFNKAASSLAPPTGTLKRPPSIRLLDYEVELGLVIGAELTSVRNSSESLHQVVIGLVLANDISARDIQYTKGQWFHGKSFRGFCPVGPILCLLEEEDFNELENLVLELRVNGIIRQKASTAEMIHKPGKTLAELSSFMNLSVGDLILTGTPGGVALQIDGSLRARLIEALLPPAKKNQRFLSTQLKIKRYLADGDIITSTIYSTSGKIHLGTQEIRISG